MNMMNVNCSNRPHFGAFRIEAPKSSGSEKFDGTEKFLYDETIIIDRLKKQHQNYQFPSPMDKIIGIISRQENNPYDIILSSETSKYFSENDNITLTLKNPEGDTMLKRRVYNSVHTVENDNKKPEILSLFYKSLDYFEKLADDLHQRNS